MKSGFKKTDWFVRKSSGLVFQGGVYPIWASYDLIRRGIGIYVKKEKEPYSILPHLKEHAMRIPFYLLSLFFGRGAVVSTTDFSDATAEFETPDDDDVILVINGFSETDINYPEPLADFQYRFKDWETVKPKGAFNSYGEKIVVKKHENRIAIYATPYTIENMDALLVEIKKQYGSITKMDFSGHGLPGEILIRDVPYNSRDFKSLPSHPEPLFANNAKIRFFSCLVANGKTGDKFASAVAGQYLKKGGAIAAIQPTSFQPSLIVGLGTERMGWGRLARNISPVADRVFSYSIPLATLFIPPVEGYTRSPELWGYETMYSPLKPIKKYYFKAQ